jgi:hypothetical protein
MRKMKTTITAFSMALLALTISSCGSVKMEHDVSPTEVKGGMKQYIDVASGPYKLTVSENHRDLRLTLKLVSKETTDKIFEEVHNLMMGPIEVQLLDDAGVPLSSGGVLHYMEGSDKLATLLKEGEENFFKFEGSITEEALKNLSTTKFLLNTKATEYVEESTSNDNSSSSSSSKTYSSADIDAMLDSYDSYTDKYIKFYKKAMKGDAAALSEYPALMEKAEEFSNKLEQADGDLSSAQMARMMKIQQKLMSAMSGG